MLIKKTYQGTIPDNKLVGTKTTSDTDGYTCNYVNNISGKLLWTNPNPTSVFSAQTITLSELSNYDMYEIVFYQATNHNERQVSSGKLQVGKGGLLSLATSTTSYRAWNGTTTSITFESAAGQSNTVLVPAYIIGYKTGLF